MKVGKGLGNICTSGSTVVPTVSVATSFVIYQIYTNIFGA
jgi:hypothetical protein